MARNIAVGIDLGTTNSVVAYLTPEGETKVLPNSEGETLTPSVVLFEDEQVIVGKAAREAGAASLDRIAECAKRDMGLPYYHRAIGDRFLPPEAIQGFILRKLHRDISLKLTDECDVVITVPAYFDEARRHATMDAGRISGLNVIDIVNEPTAAALSFGQNLGYLNASGQARGKLRVLVYDLGGGTFDVTVIQLAGSEIKILATDGDVRLGGYDWDLRLLEYAKQTFQKKFPDSPPCDDQTDFNLRRQMELVKHELTAMSGVEVRISHAGKTVELSITRQLFEELTADLLERTAFTTRQTVRAAGLTWSEIDRILLVGGSTRMPMVHQMLTELSGKIPDDAIHPDEAVARGAAICAFIRQREATSANDALGLRITDVAAHSLGIEGLDEKTLRKENITLIPKNSPLPATVKRDFVTKEDNQQNVLVRLLEGESKHPDHCTELGRARINNLPVGLAKGTKVQVVYNFDRSGRLSVEATIPGVGREAKMELQRVRALPHARLQQWKKVICQDGGYAQFEKIASIIETALAEDLPDEPTVAPPVQNQIKNTNLEPVIAAGAPLAASEVLKLNLLGKRGGTTASNLRQYAYRDKPWRNLIGHVTFSVLGTLLGIYIACRMNPQFVEYLPDWLAPLMGTK